MSSVETEEPAVLYCKLLDVKLADFKSDQLWLVKLALRLRKAGILRMSVQAMRSSIDGRLHVSPYVLKHGKP